MLNEHLKIKWIILVFNDDMRLYFIFKNLIDILLVYVIFFDYNCIQI